MLDKIISFFINVSNYDIYHCSIGNLGRVDFINENEYDLFVRPDTCNPRARFWFNFTVENIHINQRVLFNLVNLGKTRSLFRIGMTPVVKSSSRPRWQRIKTSQVYYYTSPEHDEQMVLSIAFSFDRENETYSFALSYPYSYTRLCAILKRLSKRTSNECQIIKMETIAKSLVSWYRYLIYSHYFFMLYQSYAFSPN